MKTNISIVQTHLTLNIQFSIYVEENVVRMSKLICIIVCLQKGAAITGSEVVVKCCSNKIADMGAAILFLKMADMGAAILCKWPPLRRPFVKQNSGAHVVHFVKSNRVCGII